MLMRNRSQSRVNVWCRCHSVSLSCISKFPHLAHDRLRLFALRRPPRTCMRGLFLCCDMMSMSLVGSGAYIWGMDRQMLLDHLVQAEKQIAEAIERAQRSSRKSSRGRIASAHWTGCFSPRKRFKSALPSEIGFRRNLGRRHVHARRLCSPELHAIAAPAIHHNLGTNHVYLGDGHYR